MRRALVVIHAPTWGGLHALQVHVEEGLRAAGWWRVILVPAGENNGSERLRAAGLNVIEYPLERARRSVDPRVQWRFVRSVARDVTTIETIIAAHEIDLVEVCGLIHFHGAIAARRQKRALLWGVHSTYPPPWLRRLMMPWVVSMADAVIASGQSLARFHPGAERIADRWVPFMSPVDVGEFRKDAVARERLRRSLGIRPHEVVVGTVGNRGRMKGHDRFVEVAARVRAQVPTTRFLIVGQELPSQARYYRKAVLEKAGRLGLLSGRVLQFVDPKVPIRDLLNVMDVFVLTSRAEGGAIVVAEAMSVGLPVVAMNVGAVGDYIREGVTGHLVANGDRTRMSNLLAALAGDKHRREELGRAGRAVIKELEPARHCVHQYAYAYELALNRATHSRP